MEKEERDALEKRLSARAAWADLTSTDLRCWQSCGFTIKYRGHNGKTFVIWKKLEGEPTILDVYKITDFQANFEEGLYTFLENEHGQEQEIKHSPVRLGGYDIFVHIPFMQDMQYLPNRAETTNVLRFPLVFKQSGRPRSIAKGVIYLTDVTDFIDIFPQFADRKF